MNYVRNFVYTLLCHGFLVLNLHAEITFVEIQNITKEWSISCPIDRYRNSPIKELDTFLLQMPENHWQMLLKDSMTEVLFIGLTEFNKINPSLSFHLIEKLKVKKATLICETMPKKVISITKEWYPDTSYHMYTINIDMMAYFILTNGMFRHFDLHRDNVLKQTLLHEVFHLADMDNVIRKDHNLPIINKKNFKRENDFIYSCLAEIFPTQSLLGAIDLNLQENKIIHKTYNSCSTCYTAYWDYENDQVTVPKNQQDTVSECQNVKGNMYSSSYSLPFEHPYLVYLSEKHFH